MHKCSKDMTSCPLCPTSRKRVHKDYGRQRGFGDTLGAVVSAHKWMVVGVGGGGGKKEWLSPQFF